MNLRDDAKGKPERLLQLEKSWNDNQRLLRDIAQPKRQTQMSADIKKFIFKSVEGDYMAADREAVLKSRKLATSGSYNRISSTFNFVHHEGSNNTMELKVVKIILVREDQLMGLRHLSSTPYGLAVPTQSCLRILETLAQIRESTLNYLEALCAWRQSIPHVNVTSPRPFLWERKNYTLRLINDLDYLADIPSIIRTLNIPPEQFRNNPLMLTNNLNDPSTWMDPVERAKQEAGGMSQGVLFETRLKLRYAERILLQEVEANPPSISYESSTASRDINGNFPVSSLESSLSGKSVWGEAGYPSVSSAPAATGRPTGPPGSDVKQPPHPYLLPLPGLDASSVARLEELIAPGSSQRPESRSAAASGNSAGALARRSRAGTAPAGSTTTSNEFQLPAVDNQRSRAAGGAGNTDGQAVPTSKLFAPEEDLFPPPPTLTDDPDTVPNTRTRPVSRVALSRTGIDLAPFHSEVVTTIYKYPLLIALLTSSKKIVGKSTDSSTQFPIMPLNSRSNDEDRQILHTPSGSLEQPSVYGSRSGSPSKKGGAFDRLIVKVYDVIGCSESVINVTVREFTTYREELNEKYQGHASRHFNPEDRDWWSAQIKHLVRVQLKRNGQLHMTISKKAIEDMVVAAIRKEEEEAMAQLNSRSNRKSVIKRNTIVLRNRASMIKKNEAPVGPSKTGGSPNSSQRLGRPSLRASSDSFRAMDSERAVVASTLEDDYDDDLDFEG